MPTRPGTLELALGEIAPLLASLEQQLAPANVLGLLDSLGIRFPPELLDDAALTDALDGAASQAREIPTELDILLTALDGDDARAVVAAASALVDRFRALFDALDAVAERLEATATALGMTEADVVELARQLPRRVIERVAIDRLGSVAAVANTLQLLGVVERMLEPGVPGDPARPEFERKRLHLARLIDLLRSPAEHVETLYGWGAADFDGVALLERLEDFFARTSLPAVLVPATPTEPPRLRVTVFELVPDANVSPPGLTLTLETSIEADLDETVQLPHEAWTLRVTTAGSFAAGLVASIRPPANFALSPPQGTLDGALLLRLVGEPPAAGAAIVLLGEAGSSRLEAGRIEASLGMRFAWDGTHAIGETVAEARIERGNAVLDPSAGDSFLTEMLGGFAGRAAFELRAFWSAATGLRFQGSSALEIAIPVHVEVGAVELTGLVLRAAPGEGAIPAEVSGNFRGTLGPLRFTIERMGLEVTARVPERRGNLGPVDIDAAFKPPNGVGLTVEGGGFSGGGFLSFDEAEARYVGALELDFQSRVQLKAIGLLDTRLPGGESGFSLLVLITAEFNPIQLGFGFTLNGVGGLLGLNRTLRVDRLRSGLRDATLSSILFPTDPVANVDRIISDLRQVFPTAPGRFVFGPVGRIGWGTPTLITIDAGLAIEVPEPVTLALVGVLRALLPDEDRQLLRLQVNFLGVIDFEREQLSFDATIFDSKLLGFTLSGDMAFRLRWGNDPAFLLTVGGFHPSFQPPALGLPTLRRLTVQLLDGTNPRLTLEAYFAVTSNTVQFGSRLELLATAGPFNVYGFLAFDVLFQFSPFYFIAAIGAMLALRRGSSSIASIKLDLTLEGPTPWKAKGTATLKLCWFLKVKVRFDRTFGQSRDTRLDDIDVLPLLVDALRAPGNWEALLPARRNLVVTVREVATPTDTIVAQPIGVLAVSQKLVPLNVPIATFGHRKPRDGPTFRITDVTVQGGAQSPAAVKDHFAPAQFFERSDAEKLSARSFERYDSGVRFGETEALESSHVVRREVEYELSFIDSQRDTLPPPRRVRPDLGAFAVWASRGAIARSPLSHARTRKSALAPAAVRVAQESYAVVGIDDLAPASSDAVRDSEAEALAHLDRLIAERPSLAGRLQVIPTFELA